MLFKTTCISLLMLASVSAFSDKVVITGAPIILEESEGAYVTPENFNATGNYFYVTIAGTNKVCYASEQPAFASLNGVPISVRRGKNIEKWHCYDVNPTYFEVHP